MPSSDADTSSIFPPTRIEKQALDGVGDRLRSAAGAVGDQIMEAGRHTGEKLSTVAKERGMTSEGLKEAAQEVGETFSSALSGEERQKPSEGARTSAQSREARSETE